MNRLFRLIPGLLLWLVLLAPLVLSFVSPDILGYGIVLLAAYWLYRAILFTFGLAVGYYRYRKAINNNWFEKCKELDINKLPGQSSLPSGKLPKHLLVIPIGGARYNTLQSTLEAIANQNYPKELIYISLSFEERLIDKDPRYYRDLKQKIRKEFSEFGDRFMIFDHPDNVPNEVRGAAANRSWGNKKAVEMLEQQGENLNDFISTSPDEDIRLHPEYLGALSYKYLTTDKRLQRFYQTAVYLFANNYWEVPSVIRTWSMSLTMPVLASSVTHRTWRETWSCYSVNLKVLKDVDYWDTSICIDDTPFYWRPFDHFNGEFECEIIYTPLFADAVYHPNRLQNYIAQYRQLIRWGWGVIAFPIALRIFIQNKKIPLSLKLKKLAIMIELFTLMKVATVLFTFAIPVMIFFNNDLHYSGDIYIYSYTLSAIMQVITILMLPMLYFKFKLLPSYNKSKIKPAVSFLIEIPLHFVILYTYALFPFLIGPTKMMFGYDHKYKVVEKF